MSSALVRQALAFVDQEESGKNERRTNSRRRHKSSADQGGALPYSRKAKKVKKIPSKSKDQQTEENIKKLLILSKATADKNIAEKIVERAVKGKALAEKIEVKVDEEKSILFPEEGFKQFEREYFCS